MKYVESVLDLIGETPIIKSNYLSRNGCEVFIKLEYYNPGGSIKDRTALGIIEKAEQEGVLQSGGQVIEASSGNMAIGLAVVCAAKGYPLTLVMQEDISDARKKLLSSYGAKLIFTPQELGLVGAITEAENLELEYGNAFIPRQFENENNADIHYHTTAPEIWTQMHGKIDYFVSSVGSGGTIMGISRYLKQRDANVKVIAVEPEESAVISDGKAGKHQFRGMGAGFVPGLLNKDLIDDVIKVAFDDAAESARLLAMYDMLFLGEASSAMIHATQECTRRYPNSRIVMIGSSHGERYAGSELYDKAGEGSHLSFAQEI